MLRIERDRYGNPLPLVVYGCDREQAAFLEGFPTISAGELADELGRGNNRCVWTWREDNAPFAYADFKLSMGDEVSIDFVSSDARASEYQLTAASLRQATNYTDRRPFSLFLCPAASVAANISFSLGGGTASSAQNCHTGGRG